MKFLTAALSLLLTAAMIETTIADVCTSEIDVCVAIDNSGSVCTEGNQQKLCNYCDSSQSCKAGGEPGNEALCCENYETLTGFASTYIQQLESDQTTVHVVKYATDAESISKTDIGSSTYTGGWTNTESAIDMCKNKLENANNPVIVLITDGFPTACKDANDNTITGKNGLDCKVGDNAQEAAMAMADEAAKDGITVVPVIVTSSATAREKLHDLARCPAEADVQDCNVEDFYFLNVTTIDQLPDILDDLVQQTCQVVSYVDPEDPEDALVEVPPPVDPTEAPVPECTKNVKVLKTKGTEKFPEGAVKVLQTDETTVTVQLANAWESFVGYIFYQYRTDAFNQDCSHAVNAPSGTIYEDQITIQCMHLEKIAMLEICIVDDDDDDAQTPTLDDTNSATIPQCCDGAPEYERAACYHLLVHCEDQCLSETGRRSLLRG